MTVKEKSKRCAVCLKAIDSNCDYKQGRCPHRTAIIDIQPKDTSKGHLYISLVKSALRIVAVVFLIDGNLLVAGSLLILAEGLGIIEELV